MIEEVTEDYENKIKENKMLKKELAASKAEVERLTELLSLEEKQHEETRQLCAKILDSTRATPSREWHMRNRKVLLK